MPDLLGYRAKMGQVVPSTNTVMEPETHAMAPPGVTFHTARIFLAQPSIRSADEARRAADAFREALQIAVRDVMTAQPDHLLIGVSGLSFMGGIAGHRRFMDEIATAADIPVTTAAGALTAALPLFGVNRIGVLSPHPPMFDEHYLRFFGETGCEVVKLYRIDCPTTLNIAKVEEAIIRNALRDLCDSGAEAIVQVGTDLVMTRLADEAERWLGRPVFAVNAAMLWHALRARNIPDRFGGFGSLLRDH